MIIKQNKSRQTHKINKHTYYIYVRYTAYIYVCELKIMPVKEYSSLLHVIYNYFVTII